MRRGARDRPGAGFGYSNIRTRDLVTPRNQFRVGSVSKPITAAAILSLVDQGRLKLDQRVFGPGSLFGRSPPARTRRAGSEFEKKKPYGKHVTEITIRNLLEHTSGRERFVFFFLTMTAGQRVQPASLL